MTVRTRQSIQGASRVLAGALILVLFGRADAFAQQVVPAAGSSQPAAGDSLINADRPGIADGSTVVARGQVQLEVGAQFEIRRTSGVTSTTLLFPTLIRFGLGARWEARFETNSYGRTGDASGFAPVSAGIKYELYDWKTSHSGSMGVIARVFPASGSDDFRSTRSMADVRFAADVTLTDTLSLNPNVGLARYEDNGGTFAAGLAAVTLTYTPTDRFSPFIDVGFQQPVGIGAGAVLIVDAGFGYIVGRNVQFDISVGTGAHGPAPRPFVSFGISIRSR